MTGEKMSIEETKKKGIDPFLHPGEASEVLREFDDICNMYRINYCLACGTCLGFYRDGGFIKGDNDIDVIVDRRKLQYLVEELIEVGFKLGRCSGGNNIGSQHFVKNYTLIDAWKAPVINRPYSVVKYEGRLYPVPVNTEKYLTALYGDWKIPSKKSAIEAVHRNYK